MYMCIKRNFLQREFFRCILSLSQAFFKLYRIKDIWSPILYLFLQTLCVRVCLLVKFEGPLKSTNDTSGVKKPSTPAALGSHSKSNVLVVVLLLLGYLYYLLVGVSLGIHLTISGIIWESIDLCANHFNYFWLVLFFIFSLIRSEFNWTILNLRTLKIYSGY